MSVTWNCVVILGLVLLNGFFSGAEIALLSVRKTRLAELARQGSVSANVALRLRETPERLLATIQVGITVVGASAAVFGGSALDAPLAEVLQRWGFGTYAHGAALGVVVGGISALSIVVGELVPKSLALRSSERFSLFVASPIATLSIATRPFAWLLTGASNLVLRPFRDSTTFSESLLSREELQLLVEEASSKGVVHEGAGDIASRAIDLNTLRLSSILVPRAQVVVLAHDATAQDIRTLLEDNAHSRFPVVGEDPEDVLGYVLARDLFLQMINAGKPDLAAAMRPARFLSESRRAVEALHEMQRSQTLMSIVVDEHGGFAGIVTIEDIAEELVGDILAEHETAEVRIQQETDRCYLIVGATPLHEINRELGCDLPDGPGYTTLAGLVLHSAGRMVSPGETVELPLGFTAEVVSATARQVQKVRLRLPEDLNAEEH